MRILESALITVVFLTGIAIANHRPARPAATTETGAGVIR